MYEQENFHSECYDCCSAWARCSWNLSKHCRGDEFVICHQNTISFENCSLFRDDSQNYANIKNLCNSTEAKCSPLERMRTQNKNAEQNKTKINAKQVRSGFLFFHRRTTRDSSKIYLNLTRFHVRTRMNLRATSSRSFFLVPHRLLYFCEWKFSLSSVRRERDFGPRLHSAATEVSRFRLWHNLQRVECELFECKWAIAVRWWV